MKSEKEIRTKIKYLKIVVDSGLLGEHNSETLAGIHSLEWVLDER